MPLRKYLPVVILLLLVGGLLALWRFREPECQALPTPECLISAECLFSAALHGARDITRAHGRNYAASLIAKAQADAGYTTVALESARHVRDAIKHAVAVAEQKGERPTANQEHWRGTILTIIAGVLVKAGDLPAALEIPRIAPPGRSPSSVYHSIAVEQVKSGDIAGTILTAQGIEDTTYRELALYHIALAQAEAGDPGTAPLRPLAMIIIATKL